MFSQRGIDTSIDNAYGGYQTHSSLLDNDTHHQHHHHYHKCAYCCSRHCHKRDKHSTMDRSDLNGTRLHDNKTLGSIACQPNCWCNNLVEITCRYPTKVVTYVSLVETNNCSSHSMNMSLFEDILKQSKQIKLENLDLFSGYNHSNVFEGMSSPQVPRSLATPSSAKTTTLANMSLARIAANAIEARKNALSRISESSSLTHLDTALNLPPPTLAPPLSTRNEQAKPISSIRKASLLRASSFESHASTENESNDSTAYSPQHNDDSPRKFSKFASNITPKTASTATNSATTSMQQPQQIDPTQVFLQLFQSQSFFNASGEEKEQQNPLLIPDTEAVNRSINILDYMPCFMLHKIGVVYVGQNQGNDEKLILSNANGSVRYRHFISGIY